MSPAPEPPVPTSKLSPSTGSPAGSIGEVFLIFLRLGCTSFGGPIAHLGYYQKEFVERRKWCSQSTYAEIIALAQSLPGPASTQVGYTLGILRAGLPGGLAAWCGFTLPSALLMLAFAYGQNWVADSHVRSLLHGLQLVAVAVVANAIVTMQRSLAPDLARIVLALLAAAVILFVPGSFATLFAIGLGAAAGLVLFRGQLSWRVEPLMLRLPRAIALLAAALFFLLLFASLPPAFSIQTGLPRAWTVFAAFYRSGALVFGGGHVVLPMLENAIAAPGWVSQPQFLSGYGAAQALPGPLFTFAAYLGAVIRPEATGGLQPVLSGLLALVALFAPGLLAVTAVLPFWSNLRANPLIRAALTGMNAAVVGILLAALYRPLWTSTIHTALDLLVALLAFLLLTIGKAPPWLTVLIIAALAVFLGF